MTRILIIEDEGSIRKGLTEILRLEGFEILQADNGQTGANLALEYLPDIIISDILMPVMNGHQVLKHLSTIEKTRHIPFIFISALADRDDFRKGMNSGADDYLTKPFTRAELLNAIQARLEKVKNQQERVDQQMDALRSEINSGLQYESMTPLNNLTDISNYLEIHAERADKETILKSVSDMKSNIAKLRHIIEKHHEEESEATIRKKPITPPVKTFDSAVLIRSIVQETAIGLKLDNRIMIEGDTSPCQMEPKKFSLMFREVVETVFNRAQEKSTINIKLIQTDRCNQIVITYHDRLIPCTGAKKSSPFSQSADDIEILTTKELSIMIARLVVKKHGGNLVVECKQEQGTSITITLPMPSTL